MIYLKNDSEIQQECYIPRTVLYTGSSSGGGNEYWTTAQTMDAIEDALEDYTPTDEFATINGQVITSGGNITVEPKSYSAGTNIDITDDVISVTGITVPTKVSDLQNDAGYITDSALSGYAESSAVTAEISAATSGLAESSAVTQEINTAVSGLASETYVDNAITAATSGLAESSAVTAEISAATSGLAESSAVTAEISAATSGLQETLVSGQNIKTINNESLLGQGNITISGGSGGAAAVEMTQAQYDALSGNVSADTFYVISDATPIDMSNYATTGDLATLETTVSGKADKQNVTARTSGYRFVKWNSDGIITGEVTEAYQRGLNINGSSRNVYADFSGSFGTVYGPTTAGSSGQIPVSTGSGAPSWATILQALGVDFWIGSQDDYDAMSSHSNTTLYIIDPDL